MTAAALSEDEAARLAGALKALADPIRVRLVSLLATSPAGEVCACDLPPLLGRAQPTVSHHLKLLCEAGLLRREQRGRWAWFRLAPGALDDVCAALGAPRPRRAGTRPPAAGTATTGRDGRLRGATV